MYNEEKNIESCVNNLSAQSSQNFHAIFIDDGSTDNTVVRLETLLEQQNKQFSYEIISQKNSGAAKARENGILLATTKYVMIFDCDDIASIDYISATESSLTHNPDISLPKLQFQQKDNSFTDFVFFDDRPQYSGLESLEYSLGRWKVHGVMCAKKELFLKSYNTYRLYNSSDSNYINNDEIISRLNFFYAQTVIKNRGTYFYLNNPSSTTKRVNNQAYLMGKNAIILYNLFGKDMGKISINTQQDFVETLWRILKYARKHKKYLSNISDWKKQIIEMLTFIHPEKKRLLISFKNKIRLLKASILVHFL